MKRFWVLLVSAMLACGGSNPGHPTEDDADTNVLDANEVGTDSSDEYVNPDSGTSEGGLWSNCPGPQSGCGNAWCWPNCGTPGQGSGGTFGHQSM